MRSARIGMLLALAVQVVAAASLTHKIERLIAGSPTVRSAFWGIQVVDLKSGKTLCALNPDRFFIPASNTKLFTTSLALTRLGPAFTFQTRVLAERPVDADGVLRGPLRLVGGGDPNLSARQIPYHAGPVAGDPLAAIHDLADQVAAKGVKRIEGEIVGDDTWYLWEPYADGWGIDDPLFDYGTPVSALMVNDGTLNLSIQPGGSEGTPAALTVSPAVEYYAVDNRIRTVAAGGERRIHYQRASGGSQLELWGTLPQGGRGDELALGVEDPALYAALALRQALEERGIAVTGEAVAQHLYPSDVPDPKQGSSAVPEDGVTFAQQTSAPLIEDLRITDKVSQNLHAEMALRAVGRARRNMGSLEAGLAELKGFLDEVGIPDRDYSIHDGSGLSRMNLVTPAAVVKLLLYMYAGAQRDNWISLLPVGGQDGTLGSRFKSGETARMAGKVFAKTGSVSHVNALSGYAVRRNGRWVAFSILVNNSNVPAGEVRGIMDRICTLIGE